MTVDDEREIVVSRVIDGPRNLVFEAFTAADHLNKWWGPNGFSITTSQFDFTPGGVWEFVMHGPDGSDYPNNVRFDEITPPERIVVLHGERADDPDAFQSIITLTEANGGTEVTLRSVFQTKEQRDTAVDQYYAIEGGKQTLGRLAEYLSQSD